MVNAHMLFILRFAYQQAFRVGQEYPMDETKADVVPVYANLAYTRADGSAAFLEIVAEAPAVLAFGRLRGNTGHDIPDFQHNIPELRGYIL